MTHKSPFEIEYLCRVDSREPPAVRIMLDAGGSPRRVQVVPGARLTFKIGEWDVNRPIVDKRE